MIDSWVHQSNLRICDWQSNYANHNESVLDVAASGECHWLRLSQECEEALWTGAGIVVCVKVNYQSNFTICCTLLGFPASVFPFDFYSNYNILVDHLIHPACSTNITSFTPGRNPYAYSSKAPKLHTNKHIVQNKTSLFYSIYHEDLWGADIEIPYPFASRHCLVMQQQQNKTWLCVWLIVI